MTTEKSIDYRQQLRDDIIEVMYNYFFNKGQYFLTTKQIYDLLEEFCMKKYEKSFITIDSNGLLNTYELGSNLTYLTEKGYLKIDYIGLNDEIRIYRISVEGIDYFEKYI